MLRRLGGDRSGTSAIEFAIVAMPLFAFIFMIFQVALYYFSTQSLDYATRQVARQIMVGSVSASVNSASALRDGLICPAAILPFSCDRMSVNAYKVEATSDEASKSGIYRFIDTATSSLKSDPHGTSFCIGGPSDYVFLDVTYAFPNFLGTMFMGEGENRDFKLRSSAFFRNEPYKARGSGC